MSNDSQHLSTLQKRKANQRNGKERPEKMESGLNGTHKIKPETKNSPYSIMYVKRRRKERRRRKTHTERKRRDEKMTCTWQS
jgi:hypothetical protein